MKKTWYHGTIHSEKVLKEGFVVPEQPGIWGNGVYFTDSVDDAAKYGSVVLEMEWDDDNTLHLVYESDIPPLFPFLSFEEEEGEPLLAKHAALLKKDAVTIRYADGCTNMVIFDPALIPSIKKHQAAVRTSA